VITFSLIYFVLQDPPKKKWTSAEIDELKILFKDNLRCLTTPGMKECQHAIALSENNRGHIFKRQWEIIKKIRNTIKKISLI